MKTNTERKSWSVNSGSGKKCSLEELKERNLPSEVHPSAEEWANLLTILSALYRLTAAQADGSKNRLSVMRAVGAQMETLAKEAMAIRQLLERREQAGKKNGRWRLPQVTLPRPRPTWLWVIPISLRLRVMWYSGAAIWNNLLMPLSQLLR